MRIEITAEQSDNELGTVRGLDLAGQAATLPKAQDIWRYNLEVAGVRNSLASKNEALKADWFAKR